MLQQLDFVMLYATNFEEAVNFYTQKLDMEIDDQAPGFVQFKRYDDKGAVFALTAQGDGTPVHNAELWWLVDNADATHDDLVAKGIEIAEPLQDQPFGRTFAIKDPAGNTLYMMQLRK
ncbi:MAG TPA: VOC family protein [Ktedonobacteraceae bacterium]|nr:VOC family protein [Ktedonobacteraceae bacterium]